MRLTVMWVSSWSCVEECGGCSMSLTWAWLSHDNKGKGNMICKMIRKMRRVRIWGWFCYNRCIPIGATSRTICSSWAPILMLTLTWKASELIFNPFTSIKGRGHHGIHSSPSSVTRFSWIKLPIAPESNSMRLDFSALFMWTGMLKCLDSVYSIKTAFIEKQATLYESTYTGVSGLAGLSRDFIENPKQGQEWWRQSQLGQGWILQKL